MRAVGRKGFHVSGILKVNLMSGDHKNVTGSDKSKGNGAIHNLDFRTRILDLKTD